MEKPYQTLISLSGGGESLNNLKMIKSHTTVTVQTIQGFFPKTGFVCILEEFHIPQVHMDEDSDQPWPTVFIICRGRKSSHALVLSFPHLRFYKVAPMVLNRCRHDGSVITGPHLAFITH